MGNKLYQLFEYQDFMQNKALAKVIDETGGLDNFSLSDEDLMKINAAGIGRDEHRHIIEEKVNPE